MPKDTVLLVKYLLFILIQGSCSISMNHYQVYILAEEDFVPVTINVVKSLAWCALLLERESALASSSSNSFKFDSSSLVCNIGSVNFPLDEVEKEEGGLEIWSEKGINGKATV